MTDKEIIDFIDSQKRQWGLAADNYAALDRVTTKPLGCGMRVQHNPARIVSTGAKVDKKSIDARACFLCAKHRPLQQTAINWGDYQILVNPYPIFPRHLTIPVKHHLPQRISARIGDMARLAQELPGYTVLYNGPQCGASAPDHMHFQAGNSDFLPIWSELPPNPDGTITTVEIFKSIGVLVIRALSVEELERLFDRVYNMLPPQEGEPMMNILMRCVEITIECVVIPRKRHRPSFFGTGVDEMMISPASVDLGGVIITPRREDYDIIDDSIVKRMSEEVCYTVDEISEMMSAEAIVSVGILSSSKIELILHGDYLFDGDQCTGAVSLSARHIKDTLCLIPLSKESFVEVKDVTIGVNFHWQRRENQCFKGAFRIVKDESNLVLINDVDIEEYLTSVISSEMNATSSIELLKAHAVISRSWVMAQKLRTSKNAAPISNASDAMSIVPQHVVWYDHDDHKLFDVCADDHCQRYQGITRASTKEVVEAISATRGQVLTCNGQLCDARFSKCCGGVMEAFENCWEDTPHPYLSPLRDSVDEHDFPDLSIEDNAREWILSSPMAFCNTTDTEVLRQVLNNYDTDTTPDFYRWTVDYDTDTLSDLVARKSGFEFGRITDLIPLRRGASGRITLLRIVGENLTMNVGKELEIRRWLSETHLFSSAFVVDRTDTGFRLHGAGWGHGVGLCQIGAAMMAHKGYDYRRILAHYYPGAQISDGI